MYIKINKKKVFGLTKNFLCNNKNIIFFNNQFDWSSSF